MNSCRKTLVLIVVVIFTFQVYGQEHSYNRESVFKKTIEPAMIAHGLHNTKGKTAFQLKFFPKYNGSLEFFVDPSYKGASGFRIDSIDGAFFLDVKWITNREEVYEKVREEFPSITITKEESDTISKEEIKRRGKYNGAQLTMMHQKAFENFEMASKKIQIDHTLFDQLYNTTVSLIKNYTIKGIPTMSRGGYSVIFRCVVEDEVWNYFTFNPFGVFKELTNICNQIVSDVQEDGEEIDEEKYIVLLKNLVEVN